MKPRVPFNGGTLGGSDALIGLRSRGDTNRPFTLVARMQSDAVGCGMIRSR